MIRGTAGIGQHVVIRTVMAGLGLLDEITRRIGFPSSYHEVGRYGKDLKSCTCATGLLALIRFT